MILVITLFVAGIILLAVEVVVPGGILGIAGGILVLLGVTVAFFRFGVQGGAIASGAAVVLGAIVLFLEFVLLPKSRIAKALSMTGTVAGRSQPPIADRTSVLGRHVTAVTQLAPSGYVELEGRRYEAFTRSGLVQRGERLEIVDVDNFRLIVTKPSIIDKK
jgi:membrane-bound ClpP family serine protease